MKNKSKKKKFDAVAMMREIRDNLSQRYLAEPGVQEKELRDIRLKYGIKTGLEKR